MRRQKEGKRIENIENVCEICGEHCKNLASHTLSKHRKIYQRKIEKERKIPLEKF